MGSVQEPFQWIAVLIALSVVIFLAYLSTRLIGGRYRRGAKGRNLRLVESMSFGMDKQLHLVRAGGQYVLLSTHGKSVSFLTVIDGGGVSAEEYGEELDGGFRGVFGRALGRKADGAGGGRGAREGFRDGDGGADLGQGYGAMPDAGAERGEGPADGPEAEVGGRFKGNLGRLRRMADDLYKGEPAGEGTSDEKGD